MHKQYNAIFLNGFRGSGKSTIGSHLAERLRWNYVEMDYLISQAAGESINAMTKNGTSWQNFRLKEHNLLQELLSQKNIVVSTGGGVGVNSIVKEGTNRTFGAINAELMKRAENVLLVVLLTDESVLMERIRTTEMTKEESNRPILDEKKAKALQESIKPFSHDPKKQKQMIVDAIIEVEMNMYHIRKPLYEKLSRNVIDTGKLSIDEAINEIARMAAKN